MQENIQAVPTAHVEPTLQQVLNRIESVLSAIQSTKPMLDFAEAVIYTGLASSYLYKLTSSQQIPHYKPGGKKIFFDRVELDAWLRQGRVSSLDEINAKATNHVVKVG